ncbi:hypothetical protein WJX84_012055 [Apatococcus fuscideae]|uniref:Uncharacterized protein n=1 Tax=Apatococcus fuscideae TaxID=2026836 RepID=A0AAW1TBH8_9CHLO
MQPYLPGGSQGQTERPTCEITPSAASQEAAGSSVALTAVENPPDAAILAVEVSSGLQLEGHSRRPTFSVPTARPDVQYVAVVGYPGKADASALARTMKLDAVEATELSSKIVMDVVSSGCMVASPGQLLLCDGRYLHYNASAVGGLSGSIVCPVDQPFCMLGTHLGGFNEDTRVSSEFNTAVSVLHPVWALAYVENVLPAMLSVKHWPEQYMPWALSGWLKYHEPLLRSHGRWTSHASYFLKQYPGA